MSSRYKVYDDQLPHFVTSTVIGWVDALSRDMCKDIVCDSLIYCCKEKGLLLHAWVIMSNHIHLIISTKETHTISAFMRDFKKHTSKKIVNAIQNNVQESRRNWMLNMFGYAGANNNDNQEFQFWQADYHPVALDTQAKTLQKLRYLHENPVRAGIVWQPQHYKYSSAIDYYEDKPGLLPISRLEL